MDLNYPTVLRSWLRDGDVLLIVPPFASLDQPVLSVHVLQACAREVGFQTRVLYANFLLAAAIGIENYVAFTTGRRVPKLLGECMFARDAYGLPLLDSWIDRSDLALLMEGSPSEQVDILDSLEAEPFPLTLPHLKQVEKTASSWLDELAETIAGVNFSVVGVTTSYEQTNAAVALLKRIKRCAARTITIVGGANCAGEMAQGITSLDPKSECIDYVFSGESEATFLSFLQDVFAGRLPSARIIRGQPNHCLDALPPPDFREYIEQMECFLPGAEAVIGTTFLCYENSRGCWWGEKHLCSFCGANGESIAFRQKSPERVRQDLDHLAEVSPIRRILLVDEIMPRGYFQTLLPALIERPIDLEIAGSVKANLSLDDVLELKRAGFSSIGAGIESLSSGLLALMNKGLTARQAIALLRYARAAGIHLRWNFLWGFPGDTLDMYEEMLALLPLIRHLQPPDEIIHLVITRFSPYFDHPKAYGVRDIRPLASYAAAFPPHADVAKLAVNFTADYESAAHQNLDLVENLLRELVAWKQCWREKDASISILQVIEFDGSYILVDTRGLQSGQRMSLLTPSQVSAALVSRLYAETAEIAWALDHQVGIVRDGWYIPLATAAPDLLQAFENGVAAAASSIITAEPALAPQ
jgi:ribosomal peptide maturation radical SAM protein 1